MNRRLGDVAGDVIIVGGGAAGLTAALVLARARHLITLVDDQTQRNATVDEFHGFPTRDATAPDRFRADALTELQSYDVTIIHSAVTKTRGTDTTVSVTLANGTTVHGDAVVLATGVHDELPPIDGLADRWGKSVFNCPFCDGWEHRDQTVVVIDAAPGADHLASLLRSWTPHVTVVTATEVVALIGDGRTLSHVMLRDGSAVAATAAFVKAPVIPRSSIARALGCKVDTDGYVLTSETGATSHPLVWAAGDLRRPPPTPHQVILAAGDGSSAAIDIHKAFVAHTIGSQLCPQSDRLLGPAEADSAFPRSSQWRRALTQSRPNGSALYHL
ncbi:MAG TPA: NAD(P)/FAD-dependent oxidoreductase [Ilumatobacteraceae bacterium]|nr:NAD(P)/FAD-dependent oxidoreductase [Ilumatobacteraceae bacterium]HRB01732.1 NAD(P)/FAD-dependent oxidoreductase [Ilumatobacteraceae bacterium]